MPGAPLVHADGNEPCIQPLPQDHRFTADAWRMPPYDVMYQAFLLGQQWWHNAMTGVRGVNKRNEDMVAFATRQFLDVWSPSNSVFTNPEVLARTQQEGGMNLLRGWQNFVEDQERALGGKKPVGVDAFEVGRNVAITPGKVVYRNRLIELIQYAPTTDKVRPEPVLIVPAWIMKYYILDSESREFAGPLPDGAGSHGVHDLVEEPGSRGSRPVAGGLREAGRDGCVRRGHRDRARRASARRRILPRRHAALDRRGRDGARRRPAVEDREPLAAQADFKEAGELTLFINESQLSFLEDMMWEQGFLDTKQMAGAFQILRSNDLVWSRAVRDYLMGERQPMTDLMAWNADATRMPYRMHTEYLRHLFLDNDLAEGRFHAGGKPVALTDIRAPLFAVGTELDHVAPWHSVYKFHLLTDTEITFLLTKGGHNAGIVSEPGHPHRHYRVSTKPSDAHYVDPDVWLAETPRKEGSWWPEWSGWLDAHSGKPVAPPAMGAPKAGYAPVCDAPGVYVHQQ